jgi:hypothetical protein
MSETENLAAFGIEQKSPERPESACVRWADCGEVAPGQTTLCPSCLTRARHRGHGRGREVLDD